MFEKFLLKIVQSSYLANPCEQNVMVEETQQLIGDLPQLFNQGGE